MSRFRVLDASSSADRAEWADLWDRWAQGEPWVHPHYVQSFCDDNTTAYLVSDAGPSGAVLYPVTLRELSALPWTSDAEDACDLLSPYGYGGAHCYGNYDLEDRRFWGRFDAWAKSRRVVSSFDRLSVFPDDLLPMPGKIIPRSDNIVRSLDTPIDTLWMEYEHKVRKNVKRAQARGVEVTVHRDMSTLDEFLSVYQTTAERRSFEPFYRWNSEFFSSLLAGLGGSYAMFHARVGGVVVSSELVLASRRRGYSFLGGTRADAFSLRPNDLLKHRIIEWLAETGREAYCLGGGLEAGDGIFRYKRSFAPQGRVPFCTAERILDTAVVDELLARRRLWEARRGRSWAPASGWFPPYRSS